MGDWEQAAISLTPDVDGTHVHILESFQVEGLYVGDLVYSLSLYIYPYVYLHPIVCPNFSHPQVRTGHLGYQTPPPFCLEQWFTNLYGYKNHPGNF